MTSQEIRIALAEWDGKWNTGWPNSHSPIYERLKHVPDYPNDLNAVHELEKKLDFKQSATYAEHLVFYYRDQEVVEPYYKLMFMAAHADASQRCEALLRTLNKWKE
jgi:hypothetical protein